MWGATRPASTLWGRGAESWSCPGPGSSRRRGDRTPWPVRKTPPSRPQRRPATRQLAHPRCGASSPALSPPCARTSGDPTRALPAARRARPCGVSSGPWCAREGPGVLLESQNEPLVPRGVESSLQPLRERALARRGEKAAMTAEPQAETERRSPGLGSGRPEYRRDPALSGQAAGRWRGRAAVRAHLRFLLRRLGRGPGTSAGTKGHCAFFFLE